MTDTERQVAIRPLDQVGDLGWVVMAHGEEYAREFGWNTDFEALVARIVADYATDAVDGRDGAWIAELDGRRVGCVFCVDAHRKPGHRPPTAKLRLLLVSAEARGLGLGGRLVDTCLDFARGAGYQHVTLWTNDVLAAARHVYLQRGFRLSGAEPHRSFGADLVGHTYDLDLAPAAAGRP